MSDLVWARSFAIETSISASTLQATLPVDVTATFRDAVAATCASASPPFSQSCGKLRSALAEAIGGLLVLPSYDVTILSIVDPAASGRRQLQAAGQLSVVYEIACVHCSTCAAVTAEADCADAAGGACTWASGSCSASIVESMQAAPFGKAVLAAFLYSASVCCPTTTASGTTGPAVCAPAGTSTLPSACKDGAYGPDVIEDTIESIAAKLQQPTVVTIDAAEILSLECAADSSWGDPGTDQTADVVDPSTCTGDDDGNGVACTLNGDGSACAVQDTGHNCVYTAAVVIDAFDDGAAPAVGCLFEMVMDGLCQCDCTQPFNDELCGQNDKNSGDCASAQVALCNGLAAGATLSCDFYDNPPACNAPTTGCQWDPSDYGCSYNSDEWMCAMYPLCTWNSALYMCQDPPQCQAKPCDVDQHVVDNGGTLECDDCPGDSVNWAGDTPASGITPCRTDLSATPCGGGITMTGSTGGAIYFTNDAPPPYTGDFGLGQAGQYDNYLDCSWTIQCPAGQKPTIAFAEFSTERNFDFVQVYDGSSDSDSTLVPGGWGGGDDRGASGDYWEFGDLTATQENMHVSFTSDGSVTSWGFNAEYTCAARRRLESAYINTTLESATLDFGLEAGPQAVPEVRWQKEAGRALLTTRASDYEPREIPAAWIASTSDSGTDEWLSEWSRRQLGRAEALAPRVIPDDFISTATAPPPAPVVPVLTSPPPPPPVVINATSVALAPSASLGLGGFTPSCPGQTSGELACDDSEVQFMYFIKITQDQEVAKIRKEIEDTLVKGLWIDPQTREVVLSFAAYNGNLGLFSVVEASFTFDLGGEVSKGFSVTVLDLELVKSTYTKEDGTEREYGTGADTARIFLELCVVAGIFYLAAGELKDLYEAKQVLGKYRYYFTSMWNFVDLLHIGLYVLATFYWIIMFTAAKSIVPPQYFDWSAPEKLIELLETTDQILTQADLYDNYRALNIANLFVVLILVFKFTRFQGRLAVVNDTLSLAGEPLFHFGVIFGVCIGLYSVMGKIVFGHKVAEFNSMRNSFDMNFMGALGGWDVFAMAEEGLWGTVFFYSYTFLVFFVLINFFLAIVMEAYDAANSASAEATSVISDMTNFVSELKAKIFDRNKVEAVMEHNEDGSSDFDMEMILDERVIAVLQQIRFAAGMKIADAGMLRKAVVAKFVEQPDEDKSQEEMETYGMEIANALVLWYFETVDPEAAPEEEEEDDTEVVDKVNEIHEKIDELRGQLSELLQKAE